MVNLIDVAHGVAAAPGYAKVTDHELMGNAALELGQPEVRATDPVAFCLQIPDQMVPDESARPRDQHTPPMASSHDPSPIRGEQRRGLRAPSGMKPPSAVGVPG